MKKSVVVVIVILVLLVLGMGGYLVYDKVLSKDEVKEEKVEKKEKVKDTKQEIDINSDLVKNLVYPHNNPGVIGLYFYNFVLKDESVSNYNRDDKIIASFNYDINNLKSVPCDLDENNDFHLYDNLDNHNDCYEYSESEIISNYKKMFGPEAKYESKTLKTTYCFAPQYYVDSNKAYYGITACGGVPPYISSIRKIYKAEIVDDNLYIYDYALISFEHDSLNDLILLFKDYSSFSNYFDVNSYEVNNSNIEYTAKSKEEAQSKLEELINNGTAKTYIWTFKKQSDGKYYYYSSKWQD